MNSSPDPAALADALATVRKGPPAKSDDGSYSQSDCVVFYEAESLLARWLAANAGELWRVRGLEWRPTEDGTNEFETDSPAGGYAVRLCQNKTYRWLFYGERGVSKPCDSIEDGKAACEAHYRSRLAAALEPAISEAAK